jgi:predicted porin
LKKQAIFALTAAAVLFGAAAGASAAPVLEKISAQLNWSTKFVVNGQAWTPESNGEKLAPIIYNNTTYLPIRAVSQALDVAVTWDAETQTVYLGEKTDSPQANSRSCISTSFP